MKTFEASSKAAFAARRPPIAMITYWTPLFNDGGIGHEPAMIRHTAQSDAAYVCGCQIKMDMPSACVWLIPGMEG